MRGTLVPVLAAALLVLLPSPAAADFRLALDNDVVLRRDERLEEGGQYFGVSLRFGYDRPAGPLGIGAELALHFAGLGESSPALPGEPVRVHAMQVHVGPRVALPISSFRLGVGGHLGYGVMGAYQTDLLNLFHREPPALEDRSGLAWDVGAFVAWRVFPLLDLGLHLDVHRIEIDEPLEWLTVGAQAALVF